LIFLAFTYILLLAIVGMLLYMYLVLSRRYRELRVAFDRKVAEEANRLAQRMFEEWEQKRLAEIRAMLESKYQTKLREWMLEKEREIREDAIKRSVAVLLGRISEHIAPLMVAAELGVNPKDFRYIGSPVDYIAFKGLSEGNPEEIIFIEIKASKNPSLTQRERAIKQLVEKGRVTWRLVSMRRLIEEAYAQLEHEARRIAGKQVEQQRNSL